MAVQRRREREEISTPTLAEDITLRTHQAQQVKKRILSKVLSSMFITDVILRLIADDKEAEAVNKIISETIEKVEKDLTSELARLNKIRDDKCVTAELKYSKIEQATVEISSPMGSRFVVILRRLDEMMVLVDLLWMSNHFDGAQKKRAGYEWSRRILRAANSIIMLERRTRRAAVRQGKEKEMLEAAGDEITEVIEDDTSEADDTTAKRTNSGRKKAMDEAEGTVGTDASETAPATEVLGGGAVQAKAAASPER